MKYIPAISEPYAYLCCLEARIERDESDTFWRFYEADMVIHQRKPKKKYSEVYVRAYYNVVSGKRSDASAYSFDGRCYGYNLQQAYLPSCIPAHVFSRLMLGEVIPFKRYDTIYTDRKIRKMVNEQFGDHLIRSVR